MSGLALQEAPPPPAAAGDAPALRRVLGPLALTGIGVGGIIGTGIFVMTGIAARDKAGPAVIVSFLVAALVCACAALCYAELAARLPSAGSAYAYASAAYGRGPGWLVGWNVILMYAVAAASVAQGWSHYFQAILAGFGWHVPARLGQAPFDVSPQTGQALASGGWLDLPALLVVAVFTAVLVCGVRASVRVNAVMVVLKLTVIAFVIGVGAAHIHPATGTRSRPTAGADLPLRAERGAGCWPGRRSRSTPTSGSRPSRSTRKRRVCPGGTCRSPSCPPS